MKKGKTAKKAPEETTGAVTNDRKSTGARGKAVVILALMVILLGGAWVLFGGKDGGILKKSEISEKTLKVGDYTYTVKFASDAKEINQGNTKADQPQPYLEGKIDDQKLTLSATNVGWPVIDDCKLVGTEAKEAITATIAGKDYKVCEVSNAAYLTVFEADGQKHMLTISSSDQKAQLKNDMLRDIVGSISVSKN